MDTLKSLAVVTMLGAVLYGVYVVASKPDKPLPAEIAEHAALSDAPPLVEGGSLTTSPGNSPSGISHRDGSPSYAAPSGATLTPPSFETPVATSVESTKGPPSLMMSATQSADSGSAASTKSDTGSAYQRHDHPHDHSAHGSEHTAGHDTQHEGLQTTYGADVAKASPPAEVVPPKSSATPSSPPDDEISAAQKRVRAYAFRQAWKTAQDQVSEGRYREALLALSIFYNDDAVSTEDREALIGWLDALAAKVIYSTEHHLEAPYVVHRNETLFAISEQCHVPYMLLKNINGVRDPEIMVPGTKLKVVPGPFRAEIDLKHGEITLFVQNLYAGRFPFTRGSDPVAPGQYKVLHKDPEKDYQGPQGKIGARDPRNPYGGVWIDLGREVCIHGTPGTAYADSGVGCISLAQRDAEDLLAILSKDESTVLIRD